MDRRAWVGLAVFFGLMAFCYAVVLALASTPTTPEPVGPRVGIVEIKGVIGGAKSALRTLSEFRKDKQVVAVLVRINSPGGAVGPSQEIYREIRKLRASKPVVASMGSVAASGGYYVAAACDKIVANPGTLTGSIGVIMSTTDVSELLQLARIKTNVIKSGTFKDTGTPTRPMTEADRGLLQGTISEIREQFVRDIAEGRGIARSKFEALADGRILTGEQAHKAGLVDKLGNLSDALEVAVALAKKSGEAVPVYAPKPRRGLIRQIFEDSFEGAANALVDRLSQSLALEVRDPRL